MLEMGAPNSLLLAVSGLLSGSEMSRRPFLIELGLHMHALSSWRWVSVVKVGGCSMSTVLGDPVKIQLLGQELHRAL